MVVDKTGRRLTMKNSSFSSCSCKNTEGEGNGGAVYVEFQNSTTTFSSPALLFSGNSGSVGRDKYVVCPTLPLLVNVTPFGFCLLIGEGERGNSLVGQHITTFRGDVYLFFFNTRYREVESDASSSYSGDPIHCGLAVSPCQSFSAASRPLSLTWKRKILTRWRAIDDGETEPVQNVGGVRGRRGFESDVAVRGNFERNTFVCVNEWSREGFVIF
jgi:hypothetical protein